MNCDSSLRLIFSPSNDWQDHVSSMLRIASVARGTYTETKYPAFDNRATSITSPTIFTTTNRPILKVKPPDSLVATVNDLVSPPPGRRQWHHVNADDDPSQRATDTSFSPRDSSSPIDQAQDRVFLAHVP